MLRLVGTAADGWLPSLGRFDSPTALGDGNVRIDEAAIASGREPSGIRRLLNVSMADARPEHLANLALVYGIDTFIVATDEANEVRQIGAEAAPAPNDLVAAER